jgi:hypothetical protein
MRCCRSCTKVWRESEGGRRARKRYRYSMLADAAQLRAKHGLDRQTSIYWASLRRHDDTTCAICGLPTRILKARFERLWPWFLGTRTKKLSLDHIVPGDNSGGFRLLCGACNSTRGDNRFTDEEVLKIVGDKWRWWTHPRFLFWLHTTPGHGGRLYRSEASAKAEAEFLNGATEVQ